MPQSWLNSKFAFCVSGRELEGWCNRLTLAAGSENASLLPLANKKVLSIFWRNTRLPDGVTSLTTVVCHDGQQIHFENTTAKAVAEFFGLNLDLIIDHAAKHRKATAAM